MFSAEGLIYTNAHMLFDSRHLWWVGNIYVCLSHDFCCLCGQADVPDAHGLTPLHFAAIAPDADVAVHLLQASHCSPHVWFTAAADDGLTPAHFAARFGRNALNAHMLLLAQEAQVLLLFICSPHCFCLCSLWEAWRHPTGFIMVCMWVACHQGMLGNHRDLDIIWLSSGLGVPSECTGLCVHLRRGVHVQPLCRDLPMRRSIIWRGWPRRQRGRPLLSCRISAERRTDL